MLPCCGRERDAPTPLMNYPIHDIRYEPRGYSLQHRPGSVSLSVIDSEASINPELGLAALSTIIHSWISFALDF